MNVLVVGGHGKVARRLLRLLVDQGHTARGLIRNPAHAADLRAVGAIPVMGDIEVDSSLSAYVRGSDAVVFSAGAGEGGTDARRRTVDLGGAIKLAVAAVEQDVRRYVMVSSGMADDPAKGGDALRSYLEAKAEADTYLMATSLDWTIVRPGELSDEPGSGRVTVNRDLGQVGRVTRDDVAAVLAACLTTRSAETIGVTFELFSGSTPIDQALRF